MNADEGHLVPAVTGHPRLWAWGAASMVAAVLVIATQMVEIHYGLNIWDEGFLWYGVQRVWLGEVPIRDFLAYDPGRYYWTAIVAGMWGGHGIVAIRVAVAVFQCMGLAVGLGLLMGDRYSSRRLSYGVLGGAILVLWMFPRHKLFDIALSLLLVGVVAFLLKSPTRRRCLLSGIALGVIACFGRNHGIYGLVGMLLAFAAVRTAVASRWSWGLPLAWLCGIGIGFLPIVLACALVHGFASAFWESIAFLFEVKQTNLPLPIPWPWTPSYGSLEALEALRQGLVGCFFVGLLAYPVIALFIVYRARASAVQQATVIATVCMAIPYAHYAFSRADVGHLAQGIFPALLGTLFLLTRASKRVRWIGVSILLAASVVVSMPSHPRIACIDAAQPCQRVDAGGDVLTVPSSVASDVSLVKDLVARYAPSGRSFVTAPYWAGAYALEGIKSPLWEIYATQPRSDAFQHEEISRLESARPGFVLLMDFPLDNREELRYRNTHPVIFHYIQDHFVALPSSNPSYLIFRAKGL